MPRPINFLFRILLLATCALTPLANALPAHADTPGSAPEASSEAPAEQTDLTYFPETGFRLANAKFADYFAKRGGLRTFGYPVSRALKFLGTDVQFFQRQIMQVRPDGSVGTL